MKSLATKLCLAFYIFSLSPCLGQVVQMNVKTNNNRHASGTHIVSLADTSSIIAGYTYDLSGTTITSPNVIIFRVSKTGTILWQKEIAGLGPSNRNFPTLLKRVSNGDIILATYSHNETYVNTTGLIFRLDLNGNIKWKKVIRFTDASGNVLHNPGESVHGLTELPDGRFMIVGGKNGAPGVSQSFLMVLDNTNGTSPPTIQYTEVYDLINSNSFNDVVSDGYSCYITAHYYEGGGATKSKDAIWKYNPGNNSTDTSGTTIWRRVIDYASKSPLTNQFDNRCNGITKVSVRGDKLICNAFAQDDWFATDGRTSELITLDTNGSNIVVRQFVGDNSHANAHTTIPIGSTSVLNLQAPHSELFDNSTLAFGNGSIVPNTILTRTNLTTSRVSREINLDGNQSLFDAYHKGNKLDLVGCNDNDSFKNIYILKTFTNFEDVNQNGCELSPDTMKIITLSPTVTSSNNYTKLSGPFYNDYTFNPPITTPNLSTEMLCGSLCNYGAKITRTITGLKDTLKAEIIGAATNPKYLWSTGDTVKSIKIRSNGNYTVTVTDSLGCIAIALFKVRNFVSQCAQYKNFTWSNIGSNFTFHPSPAIPASLFPSYSWSFGNGKTSSLAQPMTKLTGNGIYWVKMEYCIRDSSFNIICCDSVIKPVMKSGGNSGGGLPCNVKANFGWLSNSSGGFQFIDSTTPVTSQMYTYEWNFGDGTSSTQKNPFKLYASNGQKNVCLIARRWLNANSMYCEDTICKLVNVTGVTPCNRFKPNFTWNYSSNGIYSMTNTTDMTNFNFTSVTFTVSNGNTYSHNNPNIAFQNEGYYSITMTMTVFDVTSGLNCTKSITKHINIVNTVCGCFSAYNFYNKTGLHVNFTDASSCVDTGTKYLYKFGNGDTSASKNPSYTYSSPGIYRTVMYISRSKGGITCLDSFVRVIQIVLGDPCKDSGVVNNYTYPCPSYISPVCGCDSITYVNYCHAQRAGVKQYDPGPCAWDTSFVKVCGYVYNDLNTNCNVDSTDVPIPNMKIQFNSTQPKMILSNYNGFYSAYFYKGIYNVTQNIAASSTAFPFYQICPTGSISVAANTPGVYCNNNFYDTSKTCPDLEVKISKIRRITPGFISKKRIMYKNNGATSIPNVLLHYRFLSPLNLRASTTPTYNVSGNVITWNLGTLAPYAVGFKNVHFNTPTTLPLGTTVIDSVWIEPLYKDCNPSNNSHTIEDTCVGSYDPNAKGVAQSRFIDTGTKTLDYNIEFQNTGTAPAYNVLITDVLDNNLDVNTLHVYGSSHKMDFSLDDNRQLNFEFQNIMLPDSGTNYDASQGFISYSIDVKRGLPIGTEIKNTASIFFDFNDAIITNTTINTIHLKTSSGVSNTDKDMNISIFPNPVSNTATLMVKSNKLQKVSYSVFDLAGKHYFSRSIKPMKNQFSDDLDFENLSSGIYILNVHIDGKERSYKIVKK